MAEQTAPILIADGKFEVVGVEKPSTFIFEGTEYKFECLTEQQADSFILKGYPHLKRVKKLKEELLTEGAVKS